MAEPWTFNSPISGYRGASTPWLPDSNETWRRDLLAAPRSGANRILDLQQDVGWQIEALKDRGLEENLQAQADFLKTFGPNERLNIYEEPTTDRGSRLNKIINANVQGQDKLLQAGLKSYPARLREYQQQLSIARQQQALGLDRAKFTRSGEQYERNQDLTRQKFQFDQQKAKASNQYRNKALNQSGAIAQQRLQLALARDQDKQYDQDYKEARDAVLNQGMDPEEAADLFGLDPEDIERLDSYAGLLDAEDDVQAQQMSELLNAQEMALRQKKPRTDVEGEYVPLPTLSAGERAPLLENMYKMGGAGLVQPRGSSGFAPVGRNNMFPERTQVPGYSGGVQSSGGRPVLTPQQVARVPVGTKYMGTDGIPRTKR